MSWRWATPRRGLPLLLRKGAWLWDPALLCDMEQTLTPLFIPALLVLGASELLMDRKGMKLGQRRAVVQSIIGRNPL